MITTKNRDGFFEANNPWVRSLDGHFLLTICLHVGIGHLRSIVVLCIAAINGIFLNVLNETNSVLFTLRIYMK